MAKDENKSENDEANLGDVVALLKELRELQVENRETQVRYLWILFPILGVLLIQTVLDATQL